MKFKRSADEFLDPYDSAAAEELAHGVADFCLTEENGEKTLVYTNGKHIFQLPLNGGKRKKIADVDFCIKLGCAPLNEAEKPTEKEETDDFFSKL